MQAWRFARLTAGVVGVLVMAMSFCEIDGRVLGSMQFGFLCRSYNIFGMLFGVLVEVLFRCWRAIVARVSLSGVYGGVNSFETWLVSKGIVFTGKMVCSFPGLQTHVEGEALFSERNRVFFVEFLRERRNKPTFVVGCWRETWNTHCVFGWVCVRRITPPFWAGFGSSPNVCVWSRVRQEGVADWQPRTRFRVCCGYFPGMAPQF